MFGFHILLCTLILERNKKCRGYGEGYTIKWDMVGYWNCKPLTFVSLLTNFLNLKTLIIELPLYINEKQQQQKNPKAKNFPS